MDRDGDPDGKAVAVIDIVAVREWTEEDARKGGQKHVPGYHAWEIANVRPIKNPVTVPAERMIYEVDVPDDLLA